MRCCALLRHGGERPLTAASLLQTVRSDPGMTTVYYANRYFGKENVMQLNHLLWSVLKRNGKVDIDRAGGAADAAPRWQPLFATPRKHIVRHHNADDEDLSLLRHAPPAAPVAQKTPTDNGAHDDAGSVDVELESAIVELVQAMPGMDILHYVMKLPESQQRSAPSVFRRLRKAQILVRELSPSGTYVWR
ncbi:hypothetical protein NESM_000301800 [Novymonas esmeraldas]|uniref:Uncharacterized protein n=1 Tax=Novymonas esmeraldas TaxID=1808958 RepID=A0AAW0F8X9_9TRYP